MSTDTSLAQSQPPLQPQAQPAYARTDSLFVGNLSYFCNNDHLWTLFSPHGIVQSAIVCRAKNKDPLYYGFVNMAAGASVETAIATLNNSFFMGRRLKVMRSSRGSNDSQATPRHSSSSQDIEQGYQILVSFVSAAAGGSASAPPFHVNEDCLFRVFSRFGVVLDVLVKQYTHSTASAGPPPPGYPHAHERPATVHKQCGYGFVLFEDWAAAQQAMAATRLDPQGDQTLGIKLDCRLSTLTAQKLRREGIVVNDATAAGAPDTASYRTKAPKQLPPHQPPQTQPQPQPQPQLVGYAGASFGGTPQPIQAVPPQLLQAPYGYAVYGGPAVSGPSSSSNSPLQAPWPQAPGSSTPSVSSSSSNSPPPTAIHAPNAAAYAYPAAYPPQWQLSPHSAAMSSGGSSPPPPPPPSFASSPSLMYVPVHLQPQLQQYQQYQQLQQLQQYHQLQQLQQMQQPFQSSVAQTSQGYAVGPPHSVYAAAAYAPHGQPLPQHPQHGQQQPPSR